MSKEDLIPFTKETAKEAGRKGGIASGKSRRRKKSMKQAMNTLLSLEVSEKSKDKLKQLGIDEELCDNQMLMMVSAFQKAVKGDTRAMHFIASITGDYSMNEAEKQKVKIEKEKVKLNKEKLYQSSDVDVYKNPLEGFTTEELKKLIEDD